MAEATFICTFAKTLLGPTAGASIMKQDFSWTKWGEKFVHTFAKSGGFLVICFLFLSAQCISSIGQII